MIEIGYKKLISYECKDGGFEWFGQGKIKKFLYKFYIIIINRKCT